MVSQFFASFLRARTSAVPQAPSQAVWVQISDSHTQAVGLWARPKPILTWEESVSDSSSIGVRTGAENFSSGDVGRVK